jgi:hypothetical protein
MAELPVVPDTGWFCPLLNRRIAEGHCLDINYQRLGLCKPDVLSDVQRVTCKTVAEIASVCEGCPNQPLRDEPPHPPI